MFCSAKIKIIRYKQQYIGNKWTDKVILITLMPDQITQNCWEIVYPAAKH